MLWVFALAWAHEAVTALVCKDTKRDDQSLKQKNTKHKERAL